MTDTTTPAELEIPQQAVATLHVCDADSHLHDRAETCVAAISRPVVAAELRRIATQAERELQPVRIGRAVEASSGRRREGVEIVVYRLRSRADELDPT